MRSNRFNKNLNNSGVLEQPYSPSNKPDYSAIVNAPHLFEHTFALTYGGGGGKDTLILISVINTLPAPIMSYTTFLDYIKTFIMKTAPISVAGSWDGYPVIAARLSSSNELEFFGIFSAGDTGWYNIILDTVTDNVRQIF